MCFLWDRRRLIPAESRGRGICRRSPPDPSGAIRAGSGLARTTATGRIGINGGQHTQQRRAPAGAGGFPATTHPGYSARPNESIMHRCGSLGIRLAHQTSPPSVDVPSKQQGHAPNPLRREEPESLSAFARPHGVDTGMSAVTTTTGDYQAPAETLDEPHIVAHRDAELRSFGPRAQKGPCPVTIGQRSHST